MERLVIDTETTGLSPVKNQTLTIGMLLIDVNHEFLDILDSSHIFIRHKIYNIDPAAIEVNKINIKEHHKIAIPPKKACQQINDFIDKNSLYKTKLLGHNIKFDKGFITSLFNQGNTISRFHNEYSDTMYFWNYLKYAGRVPFRLRSNLQTLAEFFKINYADSHNALADCHVTAKVYHEMLKINNK